jgi:hypothetical protein
MPESRKFFQRKRKREEETVQPAYCRGRAWLFHTCSFQRVWGLWERDSSFPVTFGRDDCLKEEFGTLYSDELAKKKDRVFPTPSATAVCAR